jgi:hypothetical protein
MISEKKEEFEKIADFEKILGRTLQLFCIKSLKELKNEHLVNNVLNGIVLQGEINWISKRNN